MRPLVWNNYEVRSHARGWAVVHIRTGYIVEVYRNRQHADTACARFNHD